MKPSFPKIYLNHGVCQAGRTVKGRPIVPSITHKSKATELKEKQEEKMLEMAKAIAKEMAGEIIKNMPAQQVIVSPNSIAATQNSDAIEMESSFIDPSESEDFSVNLDNIESTSGENIQDKLKKLKKLKGN